MSEHREPTPRERPRDGATKDAGAGLSFVLSDDPFDAVWDSFLESVPDAAYTQTSSWGRVRSSLGWRPVRALVLDGSEVVAGVQIETKHLPGIGPVGFAHGGPVIGPRRDDARDVAMDALQELGRSCELRYLAVRPPRRAAKTLEALSGLGFDRGMLDHLYIYFDYAVMLDLSDGEAALMSRLNKKRRQNIRFALKQGLTVRRAGRDGLPIFCRLEDLHAARLGYDRRDDAYFGTLWDCMSERGHVELFICEFQGEPVCAQLVIPFGGTSYHIERPWSGEHPELSATELVEWEAIRWAANEGYGRADLGGLDTPVGDAELAGKEDARTRKYGASLFKLKWGGEVVAEPPFVDHVYNPALRYAYRHVPGFIMRSSWLEKAAKRLKEPGA